VEHPARSIRFLTLLWITAMANGAIAQQSPSFRIEQKTLNAGGRPQGTVVAASASFRISLDAIGASVAPGTVLSGTGYRGDLGLVPTYRPPQEIADLRFGSPDDLFWSADPSVGSYAVYRGGLAALSSGDTGSCHVTGPATTVADASAPSSGAAFFYLVTVRNRIGEESTKGFRTGGAQRANPVPCE